MEKEMYLPLRLQMFAEGDSADTGADDTNETDENEQEEAKFTQADVDKIAADREKRAAAKSAKATKALQAELDALKNGEKPQEEQLSALQTAAEEKEKENANLHLQLEAMKAGVQADKLEKFIKLATLSDAEDFADKVEETLNDFPEFGTLVEKEEPKKRIVTGGNPTGNTAMTKDEFEKLGYSERVKLKQEHPETYKKFV